MVEIVNVDSLSKVFVGGILYVPNQRSLKFIFLDKEENTKCMKWLGLNEVKDLSNSFTLHGEQLFILFPISNNSSTEYLITKLFNVESFNTNLVKLFFFCWVEDFSSSFTLQTFLNFNVLSETGKIKSSDLNEW